jgi:hypothetical protein
MWLNLPHLHKSRRLRASLTHSNVNKRKRKLTRFFRVDYKIQKLPPMNLVIMMHVVKYPTTRLQMQNHIRLALPAHNHYQGKAVSDCIGRIDNELENYLAHFYTLSSKEVVIGCARLNSLYTVIQPYFPQLSQSKAPTPRLTSD